MKNPFEVSRLCIFLTWECKVKFFNFPNRCWSCPLCLGRVKIVRPWGIGTWSNWVFRSCLINSNYWVFENLLAPYICANTLDIWICGSRVQIQLTNYWQHVTPVAQSSNPWSWTCCTIYWTETAPFQDIPEYNKPIRSQIRTFQNIISLLEVKWGHSRI